jgi:hypothetical protein
MELFVRGVGGVYAFDRIGQWHSLGRECIEVRGVVVG